MAANLGEKQWYIVTTYSMHEDKTADNLRKRIVSMGMEDLILRVLVAEIDVPVLKDGLPTGKMKKHNLYPGYIFVEMIMTDESWYIVRNTPGVTGIAGSSGGGQKPTPVSRDEIEPVLKRMKRLKAPKVRLSRSTANLVFAVSKPSSSAVLPRLMSTSLTSRRSKLSKAINASPHGGAFSIYRIV